MTLRSTQKPARNHYAGDSIYMFMMFRTMQRNLILTTKRHKVLQTYGGCTMDVGVKMAKSDLRMEKWHDSCFIYRRVTVPTHVINEQVRSKCQYEKAISYFYTF